MQKCAESRVFPKTVDRFLTLGRIEASFILLSLKKCSRKLRKLQIVTHQSEYT